MHHISPIWAEMQAKSVLERTCPLPSRDWNEKVNRVLEGLFEANDGLKLEDRAYKSKIYLNTFAGNEAMEWISRRKFANTKEEAFRLWKDLFEHKVFHHVTNEFGFEDRFLFYQFHDAITKSIQKRDSISALCHAKDIYQGTVDMDDFVLMEDKFASRMTKSKGTQPSPPISQSTGITPTRSPPAEKSEEEIAEEVGVIAKKRDQLLSSLRRAQLAKGIRDQDDEEHQDPSTSTIEQLDHIQAVHQMLQEIQDALKNAPQDVLSFVNPLKEKVNKSIDHLEQYEQVARRARGDSIKRTLIEKQLRSIEELVQQDQEDAKWMKHLDSIVRIQRYYRRWQTRRKLAHIMEQYKDVAGIQQIKKRYRIANEILQTERSYVHYLTLLVTGYMRRFRMLVNVWLTSDDFQKIFSNVESILSCNEILLKDLEADAIGSHIGDTMLRIAPFFKLYCEYVNNYENALTVLHKLEKQNSEFIKFLNEYRKTVGVDLYDLLIMPIQRLPRYVLLLQELVKNTQEEHSDLQNLKVALEKMKEISQYLNDRKHQAENLAKVIQIQNNLVNGIPIVEPHRVWIREGFLTFQNSVTKDSERLYCFLFNDILMTTVVLTPKGIINLSTSQIGGAAKLPPKSKFQMKEVFLLSKVVVMRNTRDVNLSSSSTGSPIPGDLGADTSFKFIYMLNSGETKKFYVTADSVKEKEDWVKDITQLLHVVHAPHVVNEPLLGSDTVKVASTEGWLMKQGDIVKSWKRRYFRLKGDTLFYFVNEKATEPRGYVQITDGYFVIPTPSNEFPDIKFGITIAHPRKRTYYVAAENQQEYQHWLVELQKKCNGTSMK